MSGRSVLRTDATPMGYSLGSNVRNMDLRIFHSPRAGGVGGKKSSMLIVTTVPESGLFDEDVAWKGVGNFRSELHTEPVDGVLSGHLCRSL